MSVRDNSANERTERHGMNPFNAFMHLNMHEEKRNEKNKLEIQLANIFFLLESMTFSIGYKDHQNR